MNQTLQNNQPDLNITSLIEQFDTIRTAYNKEREELRTCYQDRLIDILESIKLAQDK